MADDIRSIFYAALKKKAIEFFDLFKQRWQQDLPSAVKYLDNPTKACLTFFICPVEKKGLFENYKIIERLNKGIQTQNETYGDSCRRPPPAILYSFYQLKDGIALEIKPYWKSAINIDPNEMITLIMADSLNIIFCVVKNKFHN
ncbi:MAG: transposase [Thermodesulfobacteriota bacterium]|nr:transposase [Thermodesulfobacteriota bacterium]